MDAPLLFVLKKKAVNLALQIWLKSKQVQVRVKRYLLYVYKVYTNCKVYNFVYHKMTLQAAWPYLQRLLLTETAFCSTKNWPYIRGPIKRDALYLFEIAYLFSAA